MTLTEEDPDLFDIVHTWLYTNQLTQSKDGQDIVCSYSQIWDLFVLADKLDMPSLCNMAIDILKDAFLQTKRIPRTSIVIKTYAITSEFSNLRKLLVAIITCAP